VFVIVVVRLFDIMILNHERLYARARMQQLKGEDIRVRRGMILTGTAGTWQ